MPNAGVFVFRCSQNAHEQITSLFDFASPAIVAMWNLRWQVQGFVQNVESVRQQDIVERFARGSGVRGNEILRACVEHSWVDQRSRFSSLILTNTIAIFEDFTARLVELSLAGNQADSAAKALQFPAGSSNGGYTQAYTLLAPPTAELGGVFISSAKAGRWYSGSATQNLLLCYRFFKETRNALAHGGGRASARLMSAYAAFAPVANTAALGMSETPSFSVPVLNQPIELDPRGVNWFANVILRLIATYDADLSEGPAALEEVKQRLPSIAAKDRGYVSDPVKRERRISKLWKVERMPDAILTPGFMMFLKATGRIPSNW